MRYFPYLYLITGVFVCSCRSLPYEVGRWQVVAEDVEIQKGEWRYVRKKDGHCDPRTYPSCILYEPVAGLLDGVFSSYYRDGRLAHMCVITNGDIHGLWQMWHPSGSRAVYGHVVRGKMQGIWLWWDTKGCVSQVSYVHADGREEELSLSRERIKSRFSHGTGVWLMGAGGDRGPLIHSR